LFFVRLPEFIRTTTFRWTLTIAGVFVAAALVLFAFVYRQAVISNETRVDGILIQDVQNVAHEDPDAAMIRIKARLMEDPRRVRLAGLFDTNKRPLAGNLAAFPANFEADLRPWDVVVERSDGRGENGGPEIQTARAVGARLTNGNYYIVARNFNDFTPLQQEMMSTLTLGLLPATALALLCGIFLSMRTQRRIEEIHRMAQRIVAGHLSERLPGGGTRDDFGKLVDIINTMLDQIEHLMGEIKGVGDDIAHDLRTPLTRVRASLERGRENASTLEDLRGAVDKGITGIDQALGVTTALLRIAAIEHGQRNAGFGEVDLGDIVGAIVELYEPAAEDKGVELLSGGITNLVLRGDRDLLFEAISNLVDNAIKFTPSGGTVTIELVRTDAHLVLRVADTGPGIPVAEREAVFRRFYRSDKSRNPTGMGLGLSLVAAISRLHGFNVHVADSTRGCTIEMICNPLAA
jgi:signal transduction histidine kinase